MKMLIQILKVIQNIQIISKHQRKRIFTGNMHFSKITHFMKLIKSVYPSPKFWCPILLEDHYLDVTEGIESTTCTTMLTLFKPWRHGKNLKEDDQSWNEAFPNYKFIPHQTKLMKFFNMCYECNDARDDYFKLLKEKNATGGVFPHWFNSDNNDHFDDDDDDDDGADFMVHEEYEADQYTSIGKKGQQRIEQMAEIQKIVTSAGWLDQCPGGPPSLNFERIEPEKLPPSQWDATVQEQRQQVLSERNKALPAQSGKRAGKDPNQNDVQIVDRSYLQKDFKAQSDNAQKLIED